MGVILAWGYSSRILLIIPLPQMWLGRQPKGWAQTMFSYPARTSSIISAVRSQPSPILLPVEMTPSVSFTSSWKGRGAWKPLSFRTRIITFSMPSM